MRREDVFVRGCRFLLRVLPSRIRDRDGEEIAVAFAQIRAQVRGVGPRLSILVRCFLRLPVVALVEWIEHLSGEAHAARLSDFRLAQDLMRPSLPRLFH
jgi:hypothetical protein